MHDSDMHTVCNSTTDRVNRSRYTGMEPFILNVFYLFFLSLVVLFCSLFPPPLPSLQRSVAISLFLNDYEQLVQ